MGVDGLPGGSRTGIYALRGLPITQFGVSGLTDTTKWPNELAFAVSEGYVALPSGRAFGLANWLNQARAIIMRVFQMI